MKRNAIMNWIAMSDSAIIGVIGEFIRHLRLEQNKSQDQVAKEAGINRWTIGQIENGKSITLASLIQIFRVLEMLDLLKVFTIDERISPIEYAKIKEKKRQRARSDNKTDSNENSGW